MCLKNMFIRKFFWKNNYLILFWILFLVLLTIFHLINVYRMKMEIFHNSQLFASNDTFIARKFDGKNSLY
jgi:hypothetical protein